MPSVPSNAIPRMLIWARERAGLTPEAVAEAEKLQLDKLLGWEDGVGTPSFAKLRRLASRYKRPLMVFYLPTPPTEFSVVKDFRQMGESRRVFSPALLLAIRNSQERQAWASEYLANEGIAENPLVGSLGLDASPSDAAKKFRERLGVSIGQQANCKTSSQAFKMWRSAIEDQGMFVFQVQNVGLDEMRGCALPEKYAPLAVINSKDAESAKTFTLLHEVAHILLGSPAVTGAGKYLLKPTSNNRTEKFCNQFAAEVLVPEEELLLRVIDRADAHNDATIKRLATTFAVSRAVIILRLLEVGLVGQEFVRTRLPIFQTAKPPSKGSAKQFRLPLSRSGEAFTTLALSAYHSGIIHGGELSSLLRIKLQHLPKLESLVYSSRVHE